jgi:hypothetical protein
LKLAALSLDVGEGESFLRRICRKKFFNEISLARWKLFLGEQHIYRPIIEKKFTCFY